MNIDDLDAAFLKLKNAVVTDIYPEIFPEQIAEHIEKVLDEVEDEEMACYLEDLRQLFNSLSEDYQRGIWKSLISAYLGGITWDNYKDDETGKYFTLGQVWYNRLQWFGESDEDCLVQFKEDVEESLIPLMDLLEQYAKGL